MSRSDNFRDQHFGSEKAEALFKCSRRESNPQTVPNYCCATRTLVVQQTAQESNLTGHVGEVSQSPIVTRSRCPNPPYLAPHMGLTLGEPPYL